VASRMGQVRSSSRRSTDVAVGTEELRLAANSKQSDWSTSDSMTAMKNAGTEPLFPFFPLHTHNGTVYCGILAAYIEPCASDTLLCVGERHLCAVAGFMEGSLAP
jgi:hypothetical protein